MCSTDLIRFNLVFQPVPVLGSGLLRYLWLGQPKPTVCSSELWGWRSGSPHVPFGWCQEGKGSEETIPAGGWGMD